MRVRDSRHVEFVHPLYASAVYASASALRRRDAHRALAEFGDDPEERARHLALAAEAPDARVASEVESAARQARLRGAPDTAAGLMELALRLTPPGGEVRVVAEPGLVRVEDTGPGLADDDRARAFERFYLHERYGRERPVGTGLGLAIVKELTHAMGGSVDVESEPGRLTVFTVRLGVPVAAARETLPA